MFTLVALLFLVTNGVRAEKPSMAFKGDQTFATESECQKYLSSKKGASAKKAIEETVAAQKGKVSIGIACIKTPDKTDKDKADKDNKI